MSDWDYTACGTAVTYIKDVGFLAKRESYESEPTATDMVRASSWCFQVFDPEQTVLLVCKRIGLGVTRWKESWSEVEDFLWKLSEEDIEWFSVEFSERNRYERKELV